MSMFLSRWEYCTDSGVLRSMEAPADAVRLVLDHLGSIGGDRVREGMDWSVAAEEAPAVGGVVDGRCSRVAVVGDGEEEDPVARGGDDGDLPQQLHRVPLCTLHFVDVPFR